MSTQEEAAAIIDFYKAMVASVRNDLVVEYAKVCNCESCTAVLADADEQRKVCDAEVALAMAALRTHIKRTDMQCMIIQLVGDMKKEMKSSVESPEHHASKSH